MAELEDTELTYHWCPECKVIHSSWQFPCTGNPDTLGLPNAASSSVTPQAESTRLTYSREELISLRDRQQPSTQLLEHLDELGITLDRLDVEAARRAKNIHGAADIAEQAFFRQTASGLKANLPTAKTVSASWKAESSDHTTSLTERSVLGEKDDGGSNNSLRSSNVDELCGQFCSMNLLEQESSVDPVKADSFPHLVQEDSSVDPDRKDSFMQFAAGDNLGAESTRMNSLAEVPAGNSESACESIGGAFFEKTVQYPDSVVTRDARPADTVLPFPSEGTLNKGMLHTTDVTDYTWSGDSNSLLLPGAAFTPHTLSEEALLSSSDDSFLSCQDDADDAASSVTDVSVPVVDDVDDVASSGTDDSIPHAPDVDDAASSATDDSVPVVNDVDNVVSSVTDEPIADVSNVDDAASSVTDDSVPDINDVDDAASSLTDDSVPDVNDVDDVALPMTDEPVPHIQEVEQDRITRILATCLEEMSNTVLSSALLEVKDKIHADLAINPHTEAQPPTVQPHEGETHSMELPLHKKKRNRGKKKKKGGEEGGSKFGSALSEQSNGELNDANTIWGQSQPAIEVAWPEASDTSEVAVCICQLLIEVFHEGCRYHWTSSQGQSQSQLSLLDHMFIIKDRMNRVQEEYGTEAPLMCPQHGVFPEIVENSRCPHCADSSGPFLPDPSTLQYDVVEFESDTGYFTGGNYYGTSSSLSSVDTEQTYSTLASATASARARNYTDSTNDDTKYGAVGGSVKLSELDKEKRKEMSKASKKLIRLRKHVDAAIARWLPQAQQLQDMEAAVEASVAQTEEELTQQMNKVIEMVQHQHKTIIDDLKRTQSHFVQKIKKDTKKNQKFYKAMVKTQTQVNEKLAAIHQDRNLEAANLKAIEQINNRFYCMLQQPPALDLFQLSFTVNTPKVEDADLLGGFSMSYFSLPNKTDTHNLPTAKQKGAAKDHFKPPLWPGFEKKSYSAMAASCPNLASGDMKAGGKAAKTTVQPQGAKGKKAQAGAVKNQKAETTAKQKAEKVTAKQKADSAALTKAMAAERQKAEDKAAKKRAKAEAKKQKAEAAAAAVAASAVQKVQTDAAKQKADAAAAMQKALTDAAKQKADAAAAMQKLLTDAAKQKADAAAAMQKLLTDAAKQKADAAAARQKALTDAAKQKADAAAARQKAQTDAAKQKADAAVAKQKELAGKQKVQTTSAKQNATAASGKQKTETAGKAALPDLSRQKILPSVTSPSSEQKPNTTTQGQQARGVQSLPAQVKTSSAAASLDLNWVHISPQGFFCNSTFDTAALASSVASPKPAKKKKKSKKEKALVDRDVSDANVPPPPTPPRPSMITAIGDSTRPKRIEGRMKEATGFAARPGGEVWVVYGTRSPYLDLLDENGKTLETTRIGGNAYHVASFSEGHVLVSLSSTWEIHLLDMTKSPHATFKLPFCPMGLGVGSTGIAVSSRKSLYWIPLDGSDDEWIVPEEGSPLVRVCSCDVAITSSSFKEIVCAADKEGHKVVFYEKLDSGGFAALSPFTYTQPDSQDSDALFTPVCVAAHSSALLAILDAVTGNVLMVDVEDVERGVVSIIPRLRLCEGMPSVVAFTMSTRAEDDPKMWVASSDGHMYLATLMYRFGRAVTCI